MTERAGAPEYKNRLSQHAFLRKLMITTLEKYSGDDLKALKKATNNGTVKKDSEKTLQGHFVAALREKMTELPARPSSAQIGFREEFKTLGYDIPVTKKGDPDKLAESGRLDIVQAIDFVDDEAEGETTRELCSAIELKVIPLPSAQFNGKTKRPGGYYLEQLLQDHSRLYFSQDFAEENRGWCLALLSGPWVQRYFHSRQNESELDLLRIFHDEMHVIYRSSILQADNRHDHTAERGYLMASAEMIGFSEPWNANYLPADRYFCVADFEKEIALVAIAADWTDRWGG